MGGGALVLTDGRDALRVPRSLASCGGDEPLPAARPPHAPGPAGGPSRPVAGAVGLRAAGRRGARHSLPDPPAGPGGLIRRLDEMGLLSERLTVAHGVWLRPDECELLAARGVTVSVNTSSNLRLGSGLGPVALFKSKRLAWAMGLDGMAFDDDEDAMRELRLL